MLKIEAIHVSIQSVLALRGLSLTVADGTMVGLVGRNGAGKSTLMRTVMGHLKPSQGRITLDGQDLATLPRHARPLVKPEKPRFVCCGPEKHSA